MSGIEPIEMRLADCVAYYTATNTTSTQDCPKSIEEALAKLQSLPKVEREAIFVHASMRRKFEQIVHHVPGYDPAPCPSLRMSPFNTGVPVFHYATDIELAEAARWCVRAKYKVALLASASDEEHRVRAALAKEWMREHPTQLMEGHA